MQGLLDSNEHSDLRLLDKVSWLITLISFQKDMYDMILKLDLLKFIIQLCDKKFGDQIRSNAILSISLLTYNERIFDEIIKSDVVMDMIMDICKDQNEET